MVIILCGKFESYIAANFENNATNFALMAELKEVKQELATERQEKYEIWEAYENAKEEWIEQDDEMIKLMNIVPTMDNEYIQDKYEFCVLVFHFEI